MTEAVPDTLLHVRDSLLGVVAQLEEFGLAHHRCVLRHSRTATTTDVYMQEIPESVQATVNSIHSELSTKSSSRNGQVWTAERRAQASLKSKARIAAKNISAGERKKGENRRAASSGSETGFCNLLPNATKRSGEQFASSR